MCACSIVACGMQIPGKIRSMADDKPSIHPSSCGKEVLRSRWRLSYQRGRSKAHRHCSPFAARVESRPQRSPANHRCGICSASTRCLAGLFTLFLSNQNIDVEHLPVVRRHSRSPRSCFLEHNAFDHYGKAPIGLRHSSIARAKAVSQHQESRFDKGGRRKGEIADCTVIAAS